MDSLLITDMYLNSLYKVPCYPYNNTLFEIKILLLIIRKNYNRRFLYSSEISKN